MFWGDPGFVANIFRWFFSLLDSIGYFFLSGIFNIFFLIASAEIFQGDLISTFYSRVQLILSVLMIFNLSFVILQIIVNPDMYKDKQKGAGSIVKRVALMIVMLTLIAPINISDTDGDHLNEQIKNNGILFGFLYQIQNSVVNDNILGKLILGSDIDTLDSQNANGLELNGGGDIGNILAAQISYAFITPAVNEGYEDVELTEDNVDAAAVCPDEARQYLRKPTASSLISHINDTCGATFSKEYAFNYIGFGGIICAIVMTIIIIGFTLDIAVRAIKLALLRLIAPIPIISYISPGQEKNGAFDNWVKTLTSTYLSLFLRLIIIYFGIYLIILLRSPDEGLVNWVSTGSIIENALANIFVIIGILVFMKEAPKFFQDMLGLKGDGKLFSGIGTMLGAAALTGGLAGSISSAARTGYAEGQEMGHGRVRSTLRGVGAGIGGFLGGTYLGGKALLSNDKKQASAVRAAMQKGIVRRGSGSTFFGRTKEGVYSMLTGSSLADKYDTQIQAYNDYSDLFSAFDSKADADSVRRYTFNGETNTVKGFKEQYELLRDANADEATLKAALDRYKDAKKQLQTDVITGAYNDTSFAKQMKMDYDNAQRIRRGAGLDLGDVQVGPHVTEADKFKIESFNAKDAIRNLKQDTKYKASNANKKYNS